MAKLYPFWKFKAPNVSEKIVNGGFESDFEGWESIWAAIATDYVHSGVKSCQIFYGMSVYQTLATPIEVSKVVTFKAWVRKLEGTTYTCSVTYDTDVGSASTYIDSIIPIDGEWHEIDLLSIILDRFPDATLIKEIGFHSGSSNIGDWRFDDVSLISTDT